VIKAIKGIMFSLGVMAGFQCIFAPAIAQIASGAPKNDGANIVSVVEADSSGLVHRKVSVNGIRLHFIQAGQGPTLVLLHGWANTSYAWHRVIPLLANRFTIIAPDLRGMGDSSRPLTGYDRETVAMDMRELLGQLGIKSAVVVGHDLGAHVAFELAARDPELVNRLVVLDGIIPGIPPWAELTKDARLWHWSFYNTPDLPEALIEGRERLYFSWFIHSFAANTAAVDEDMDEIVKAYSNPGAVRGGLGLFRTISSDAKRNATWLETNKLEMPVLALGGSMGVGPVLFQQMQAAARDVRGGVIENCGHWIATECPRTLATRILSFLEDTPQR
jgi:pimeloyl-ACP methyl ester carboxylesterase